MHGPLCMHGLDTGTPGARMPSRLSMHVPTAALMVPFQLLKAVEAYESHAHHMASAKTALPGWNFWCKSHGPHAWSRKGWVTFQAV